MNALPSKFIIQAPVLLLIGRLGGDVSMPDGNGRTPAHVAAAAGQVWAMD